jgi:UDP-glucose 4-epimerase
MDSAVLVTGGAGYIGSHVVAALAAAGRRCVCVDNYSNSTPEAIERVSRLAGTKIPAYAADVRDAEAVSDVVARHAIGSVIHLAGLKAVAESVRLPEKYRDNNVHGTETLLQSLAHSPVRHIVFSSSATVYASNASMPVAEDAPWEGREPALLQSRGRASNRAHRRGPVWGSCQSHAFHLPGRREIP